MIKHSGIDDLNHLLHLSMEAVRHYNGLLGERGKAAAARFQLSQIAMSHQQAVAALDWEIRDLGGEPEKEPETSHYLPALPRRAKAVALVNDAPVLTALQEGERRAIDECGRVLRHSPHPATRQLLASRLMPVFGEHVDTLQTIIDGQWRPS